MGRVCFASVPALRFHQHRDIALGCGQLRKAAGRRPKDCTDSQKKRLHSLRKHDDAVRTFCHVMPLYRVLLDQLQWRERCGDLDLAAVHCSVLVDIARDMDANVQGAMVLEPLEVEVKQQLTSEVQPPTKTLSAT
jgi:hypothetical protein